MSDPLNINALLSGYQRRGGNTGGFLKGMLGGASTGSTLASLAGPFTAFGGGLFGGIAGGIKGLAQKKAATAPTDFSVASATDAITKAYTAANGRPPGPGEVETMLRGQGLKPGDRYVGQGGLTSVLNSINSNAAQTQRQAAPALPPSTTGMQMTDTRRSVMDSLRSGTPNKDALLALIQGR